MSDTSARASRLAFWLGSFARYGLSGRRSGVSAGTRGSDGDVTAPGHGEWDEDGGMEPATGGPYLNGAAAAGPCAAANDGVGGLEPGAGLGATGAPREAGAGTGLG